MSGFTKEIIIRTLFELLNEKPLAKITVKDIVERCGVNRNTFYYHFRDISDVVESALLREVDNAFEHPVEVDSMLECLEVLVKLIGENKKAMLHIYCSVQRETFTSALDKMCQYVIKQIYKFPIRFSDKQVWFLPPFPMFSQKYFHRVHAASLHILSDHKTSCDPSNPESLQSLHIYKNV